MDERQPTQAYDDDLKNAVNFENFDESIQHFSKNQKGITPLPFQDPILKLDQENCSTFGTLPNAKILIASNPGGDPESFS